MVEAEQQSRDAVWCAHSSLRATAPRTRRRALFYCAFSLSFQQPAPLTLLHYRTSAHTLACIRCGTAHLPASFTFYLLYIVLSPSGICVLHVVLAFYLLGAIAS